jgi:hypothetical protein
MPESTSEPAEETTDEADESAKDETVAKESESTDTLVKPDGESPKKPPVAEPSKKASKVAQAKK